MKRILVIGIGAGNPEHVTIQAIEAMNRADVFFILDKDGAATELTRLREDICARYMRSTDYRIVKARHPVRDAAHPDYASGVKDWHRAKADICAAMIRDELPEGQCGAFLVWGDPSLYDSTLRILDEVQARGTVFDLEVIPGISSIQALAAAHRTTLNTIGQPVHITTGRRLKESVPSCADSTVVMLDDGSGLEAVAGDEGEIFWGAYLGTEDEILMRGKTADIAKDIGQARAAARARKGWIMDVYLLRKTRND